MRKILHVVTIMNRAGLETFIMNMFNEIDRDQFSFDFLVTHSEHGDYDDEINQLGGKIYKLGTSYHPIPHIEPLIKSFRLYKFLKSHKEYQIVHFHNSHAYSSVLQVFPAVLAGVKGIIVHSHNSFAPHPQINKFFRPVLNLFNIQRLACSELAAKWLFGCKYKQAKIIKNGIDTFKFQYNAKDRFRLRSELSLEEYPVVLHIGRFNYQKNHKYLLNVFYELLKLQPDAKLLLVGQGELEDEINNEINCLGLQDSVKLLGVRSDIPELLSASDLFLFPSLFEGLSVVLIEAQANGIPILTTNNIAHETIYSPNLYMLSLDIGMQNWAIKAQQLISSKRIDGSKFADRAGFNMKMIVADMMSFYNSL